MASTRLVIFDCDGVLIDSEIIAAHAQSQALAEHGIHISPQDAARRFAGIPDHDMWQTLQAEAGKPAPDIFLFAAQQMDFAPEQCLVVEDSLPGVRAAVAAGMRVIGYTGASHIAAGHDQRLRETGAEAAIADLTQAVDYLKA